MGKKNEIERRMKKGPAPEPLIQNEPSDLKLGFYSGSALIATVMAIANAVLAFIFSARAERFFIVSKMGAALNNEKSLSVDYLIDLYVDMIFEHDKGNNFAIRAYISAVLAAITVILFLVVISRITNPIKKPALVPAVTAVVFSAGALIVHLLAGDYAEDCFDKAARVINVMDFTDKYTYTVYDYSLIGCIVNLVTCVVAMAAVIAAFRKYKKEGKAY